jgi:hypothetical protein
MPLSVPDIKTRYQAQIAPGDDTEFYRILSEADDRLLELSKGYWTREKVEMTVVDGIVELPEEYSAIVACRIDDLPRGIRWEESEYYEKGVGELPIEGCRHRIVDQGLIDGVRTYKVTGENVEKVYALCRLAITPFYVEGSDEPPTEIRCPSLPAIKMMMLSIVYEEANSLEKAMDYEMAARKKLKEHEDSYRGIAKEIFNPTQYMRTPWRGRTNFP